MGLGDSTSTGSNKKAPKKKNFMTTISKFVKKCFQLLRYLVHLIWELLENAMQLLVFCFNYMIKLLANPTTPCVVAILAFGAVTAIAATQWYLIGVWLGEFFGISGIYGIGAGTAGVLLGLGINVYQLAPQLWKLRKDIAKAYADLNIKPDYEVEDDESIKERMGDWLSFDHQLLKRTRLVSYGLETGLVLAYCFFNGLNFFVIVQAMVSLLLPEKCLGLVSSTVSVLGKVNDHIHETEQDNVQF